MNSTTLFSMALGLQSPWQVNDVSFAADNTSHKELHLHIGFARGSRFPDETGVTGYANPPEYGGVANSCCLTGNTKGTFVPLAL